MLDDRFPEDTLFLTFEQDFRWYERDCLKVEEWLPACLWLKEGFADKFEEEHSKTGDASGSSSDAAARASGPSRVMQHGSKPGRFNPESSFSFKDLPVVHKTAASIKPKYLAGTVSPEIFELVATCNLAARQGRGDVVWFGYNCSTKKNSLAVGRVHHGSQGVAFTKQAARLLQPLMVEHEPQLFDLWLLWVLNRNFNGQENRAIAGLARSSFIVPPLGGFYEHATDIESGNVRESLFGSEWAKEGSVGAVRPTDAARQLYQFAGEDNTKRYGRRVIDLPPSFDSQNMNLFWKTMLPPPSWERSDETFVAVLRSMSYLFRDGSERFRRPPIGLAEGWKEKARRKGEAWSSIRNRL